MRTVLTSCPFCGCGCGLYVHARDGIPVGVAASPHHPVSQGRLCARGWSAHAAAAWGPRLTRPMLRSDGELRATDWGEALDTAAHRLADLRSRGRSIGVIASPRLTNEESYLAVRLARGGLGTPHVDAPLRAEYAQALAGIAEVTGVASGRGTLQDVEASDAILLVEGDLAGSHPRAASAITHAVAAGAKMVCCGPAATQMSRLATRSFTWRPGAEADSLAPLIAGALAAGAGEPGGDRLAAGLDALRASLAGIAVGDQAREAGRWLVEAARPVVIVAPFAAAPAAVRRVAVAAANLAALCGGLDRPGSALLVLPTRSNARGSLDMGVTPEALAGGRPLDDAGLRDRLAAAWGTAVTADCGLGAVDMVGQTSGLIVVGDALAGGVLPFGPAGEALSGSEVVVVLDAFTSAALPAADVVLPVAAAIESWGTVTGADGRLQRVRPCGDPPGEARGAWWVLGELAQRLGPGAGPASPDQVLEEIARVVPGYRGVDRGALDTGWGVLLPAPPVDRAALQPLPAPAPPSDDRIVMLEGVYDWGTDPLVEHAPILCREERSRRKLFPRGQVAMAPGDAEALGVRQGWLVKLVSNHGEAVLPVVLRRELAPGRLSVPFAFRYLMADVLAGMPSASVRVERV
jgi:predicted molibdopterin-dependent oxidoreductase YjgC